MVGVLFILLIIAGAVWLLGHLPTIVIVLLVVLFIGAVVFASKGSG